jgi:hypothetical protein
MLSASATDDLFIKFFAVRFVSFSVSTLVVPSLIVLVPRHKPRRHSSLLHPSLGYAKLSRNIPFPSFIVPSSALLHLQRIAPFFTDALQHAGKRAGKQAIAIINSWFEAEVSPCISEGAQITHWDLKMYTRSRALDISPRQHQRQQPRGGIPSSSPTAALFLEFRGKCGTSGCDT